MAQCATTALAVAVPRLCVRGARGRIGGLGPAPCVVSPPFPPSRLACPALCVAGRPVRVFLTLARWYAIPSGLCVLRARSGCPSGSPRVPFLCVCTRAPAASASRSPWVVRRAHPARSRRWALGWAFHAVRAPPRVLPRSLAPSVVLGGAGPVPVPPYLAWCCAPPAAWVCASRAFLCRGSGWGRWAGACAAPPVCADGGACGARGRSASFRPSCFPGQATKRVSLASFWSWRARPPYRSRSCSPAFSGRGLCGVLARWRGFACSPRFLWEPAAGAGGRAVLWPPSRALRSCWGQNRSSPLHRGGEGWRPRNLRVGGGVPGGGGSRRGPPAPPLGGGPRFPTLPPLSSWTHSPPAMIWSWGARPPYRSGAPPRAALGRGPHAAPTHWCGLAHLPRPPPEEAAGGARTRSV